MTLCFNIDSLVKPNLYDGPESVSLQTFHTMYHISSPLPKTRSLGLHAEMIYHPPLLAPILPFPL